MVALRFQSNNSFVSPLVKMLIMKRYVATNRTHQIIQQKPKIKPFTEKWCRQEIHNAKIAKCALKSRLNCPDQFKATIS